MPAPGTFIYESINTIIIEEFLFGNDLWHIDYLDLPKGDRGICLK